MCVDSTHGLTGFNYDIPLAASWIVESGYDDPEEE